MPYWYIMSKPVILITGANRGSVSPSHQHQKRWYAERGRIGLGYVKAFLEKGFTVIAAARDPSKLPQGENIIPVKIDALDSEGPKKVPSPLAMLVQADDQAIEELKDKGFTRIDIVLANAGVFPDPSEGLFKDLTAEMAEQVWRVNVSTQ
jgi:NAD(P)-dependent dehydrogenase (short-subunit alcohol dehydrogenase family)